MRIHAVWQTHSQPDRHSFSQTCKQQRGGNLIFQAQEAHLCHQGSHQVLSQAYTVIYVYCTPCGVLLHAKQLQIPHNLHFHSSYMRKTTLAACTKYLWVLCATLSRIRNHFPDKTSSCMCACFNEFQRNKHSERGKRSIYFHWEHVILLSGSTDQKILRYTF